MLRGVALKVAATLAFTAMSALIKAASTRFPVSEVVLFRSLFALMVLAGWLGWRGEFRARYIRAGRSDISGARLPAASQCSRRL